jgi:hypothetical protein
MDDYIEALCYIWGESKFHCKKNGWSAYSSDGRAAFKTLKEWGIVDENGDRLEGN